MRSCCVALVFLLVLLASGCTPHVNLNAPFHSRQPNPHEVFYTAVAANFGDSKMCEKISKRALDEDAPTLSSTEWKAILQKSECYFYVAMSTKSTKLCDSVSQIVTLPSNRSDMSEAHCRELLRKNQHYIDEPSPDYSWLADFMKEMGYRE
jgi:hypothetical protein